MSPENVSELSASLAGIEFVLLHNHRAAGVAGAWNTGLDYLAAAKFDGFVAILDDDDEWDQNHLAENLHAALDGKATVVVSGLRFIRDGVVFERPIPHEFTDRMFLVGNPGWQGSNTFVDMNALVSVGGFRDGMASLNDRDLAVRLLRHPGVRIAYTGKWTATWHLSSTRRTLSTPRSETKLRGLRWFWQVYGSEMQPAEADQFFARANELFRIRREEILLRAEERLPHREPRGDFSP